MTSLADERFRRLHEQFLDAAQTYPNLFFAAAVPVHPGGTLWTETLAKVEGIWCLFPGLEPYRWYELLNKPFYPLKPADDRWLSMEGHLWHGVFYGPPPRLQPNGQEDKISAENYRRVCESGIELFDSLARQAAAYCAVRSAPDEISMVLNRHQARMAFHGCQRVENRWLEKLCNLPTATYVETRLSMFKWRKRLKQGETSNSDSDQPCERYWEAYKLRRLPCDVFSASALAIEDLLADGKTGISPAAETEQGGGNGGVRAVDSSDRSLAGSRTTKVFVSYAHSSPEHMQTVSSLVETLRANGLIVSVDTDVKTPQGPVEGWPRWMKRQIKAADWVLVFFDELYRRRFDGEEEPHKGPGATWEGAIITHHYYRNSTKNEKFIPLLADGASTDLIPDELFGYTRYSIPSQTIELAAKLRSPDLSETKVPATKPSPPYPQPQWAGASGQDEGLAAVLHPNAGKPDLDRVGTLATVAVKLIQRLLRASDWAVDRGQEYWKNEPSLVVGNMNETRRRLEELAELLNEAVPLERERIERRPYQTDYGTRLDLESQPSGTKYQPGDWTRDERKVVQPLLSGQSRSVMDEHLLQRQRPSTEWRHSARGAVLTYAADFWWAFGCWDKLTFPAVWPLDLPAGQMLAVRSDIFPDGGVWLCWGRCAADFPRLLNDTEVKEWIERETPSAASGAGQKGEFMAFRPQRLVQVLRGIGELHRAKLDQLRFGEDGKPSWGESTSVQESKWSAEFKSLHQQLNYLLADLARQGAPQDVLEMIAASVESLEGIKGVRASFFDEVFSGLLRGREAVRRDFETRVAKMVATGETLFKAEAQGGADDPSSRVPANTLTESGDEPEPGEGTSGANSTPAADPQTKGKSMARPKYVPWPRLSDVNPANLHEYRDWLQKVIAGWREEIGSRIGENAKRAGERKTDLRDCLKAAVLHADRLGLAEVVSAHRDWLDLLGFLFAEQNPGTVLRDLRAIERTVDGKLAAAPTGKQAEGRAKAGAGSLGQIIASPKPGEPAGEITSAQSFPLLAAECYELLAIVCDSREPVEIRDLPKALAGDPLILCEHHRYVKTFNPIIEDAERRAKRRKKGYIVGSNTMPAEPTHVRITKLGRACLASYRLKSRPQQGAARVVNATDAARDKVFISYSHKDSRFLNQLLTHLKPLERAGRVTHWSDRQIRPGSEWFDQIKAAIASSKVAILLVTKDFLASDFIHEHELGPLLKEAEQGGVKILWVLVRACSYTETPLRHYQAVLPPDKPLAQMRAERDIAWVKICEEVKKAANP